MFAQLNPETPKQRRVLAGSIVLHGALLAWLLHSPDPILLTANSIAIGHNGRVVSRLYFPSKNPDDSDTSSSDSASQAYKHQHVGHEKLTWKQTFTQPKFAQAPVMLSPSATEDSSKTATLSKLGHGAAAGSPYGSLPGSPVYGDEIRPALPVATSDPLVYPWQWPDSEGRVIIEITIDERGEIVQKKVLQSLGPDIDSKCLAALENWRFQPATRNGSPIPSKQDAVFPFKARGSNS